MEEDEKHALEKDARHDDVEDDEADGLEAV
jgi:hypothetical protein